METQQARKKIQIINGPNINLIGTREPDIYGTVSFEEYLKGLHACFPDVQLDTYQSNIEGELVTAIQKAGYTHDGIVLNAAAYTHTSVAIRDAIQAVPAPVIEVHLSNIAAREPFRQTSLIGAVCQGTIAGFGLYVYQLAIQALLR